MSIKLIVTDLDNTLLNDKKEISAYSADILKACQEKGIKVAFATARAERVAVGFTKGFEPDYIISNNGAIISGAGSGGRIISNNKIDNKVCSKLLWELSRNVNVTCLCAETGEKQYSNYKGKPWSGENWNLVYTDFTEEIKDDVCKISVEARDMAEIRKIVSKFNGIHLYADSGEDWCQIMDVKSTKMNGVKILADMLGVDLGEVVAFGDDENDIEMIKNCGVGVAMKNAIYAAKQAADDICKSNNEDGVALWLEENVLKS